MCKCCQYCMESCYWHLIEKRFCFDESIALYEEPKKDEKNNNMFDNIAFYDSVSVIAGRAIVTIDPLPSDTKPIIQQPSRRLRWQKKIQPEMKMEHLSKSVPVIFEEKHDKDIFIKDEQINKEINNSMNKEASASSRNISDTNIVDSLKYMQTEGNSKSTSRLLEPDVQIRKKSLRERRMSKSLYLKLDLPKEIPIIRQHSMPKFYLDTPEVNQAESALFKNHSAALKSPVTNSSGFTFDLYSVVQIEKSKTNIGHVQHHVPIHRESSRLALIKERMKLRKSKSNLSSSNIPHSNYM